jgi:hypothetical protein
MVICDQWSLTIVIVWEHQEFCPYKTANVCAVIAPFAFLAPSPQASMFLEAQY